LASTGHRGRVDARGQPLGRAPGLTRSSDRSAAAPSRDGRRRSAYGACARPRDVEGVAPIVHHEKERWRNDPNFASGAVTSDPPAAGIDAASMARRCRTLSKYECLLFTQRGAGAAGWVGTWSAGSLSFEGLDAGSLFRFRARPAGAARCDQSNRPERQPRRCRASRRAESRPDLPLAKRRPARSVTGRLGK